MVEVDIRNLTINTGRRSPLNDASLRMCKRRKDFKLSPFISTCNVLCIWRVKVQKLQARLKLYSKCNVLCILRVKVQTLQASLKLCSKLPWSQ